MPSPIPEGRLTVLQFAHAIERSRGTVWRMIRNGQLPAPDAGGTWPVERKDELIRVFRSYIQVVNDGRRSRLSENGETARQRSINRRWGTRLTAKPKASDLEAARALLTVLTEHFDGNRTSAWKLLRGFAGIVITYPSDEVLEQLDRADTIVKRLERDSSREAVQHLSDVAGCSVSDVAKTFRKATGTMLTDLRKSASVDAARVS